MSVEEVPGARTPETDMARPVVVKTGSETPGLDEPIFAGLERPRDRCGIVVPEPETTPLRTSPGATIL